MYRILVSAVAGVLLIGNQAVAQTQQQLVGSWSLVSFEFTARDGTKHQIPNLKGILIFDANGRYAEVMGRADRPKFKSAGQATTEELAAATRDFFAANTGTWSVNEADKTLTQRFETSLRPNNEGMDIKSSVSLVGDELKLTGVTPVAAGAREDLVYRRAR